MDNSIINLIEETEKLLDAKQGKYKGVAGMEDYVKFLYDTRVELLTRGLVEDVTEDWLKAIQTDINFKERASLGKAGLLPPDEQEAWNKMREFFSGPCDLPPEVK